MPKKAGGKKKKAPTYHTAAEDTTPFGLQVNDMVLTPLGLTATVLGVKYEAPEDKSTGQLWVLYANGHEAPLEPRSGSGHMSTLGYRRCSEASHIRRTVSTQEEETRKLEERRRIVTEVLRLKALGLPIPEKLLTAGKKPAKKGKKAGASKGKKKK